MTQDKFSELVVQYERLVYTICYQFVRDHHLAQDLAQETFISAYRHIDSCPPEYTKPWLARVATNKAKDSLKSAYNRKVYTSEDSSFTDSSNILFMKSSLPEDISIEQDTLSQIQEQVYSLNEPYLKVSVMHFIEDKSVEDIATVLNRPSKTVHTQLYRAKRILQEKLKGEGLA